MEYLDNDLVCSMPSCLELSFVSHYSLVQIRVQKSLDLINVMEYLRFQKKKKIHQESFSFLSYLKSLSNFYVIVENANLKYYFPDLQYSSGDNTSRIIHKHFRNLFRSSATQ